MRTFENGGVWSLFFSLLLFSIDSNAQPTSPQYGLCSNLEACRQYQGGLSALEIPVSDRKSFAAGSPDLRLQAPLQRCYFITQKIALFVRSPQDLPLFWGEARITGIDMEGERLWLDLNPIALITEEILAPECPDCAGILDQLPPPHSRITVIDLRAANSNSDIEIPGAQRIPFSSLETARFPWSQLPSDKSQTLIFVAGGSTTHEAFLFPLFKALKEKSYKAFWFYPGATGLMGYVQPPRPPEHVTLRRVGEIENSKSEKFQLLIVGRRSELKIPKTLPLPYHIAYAREGNLPANNSKNPFVRRSFPGLFDFHLKGVGLDTKLILLDRDAADTSKYQAADILRQLGYFNVTVIPSGLAGLHESRTVK